MRGKIDCFLACGDVRGVRPLVETLRDSRTVHNINLIMTAAHAGTAVDVPEGCGAPRYVRLPCGPRPSM